MAGGSRAEEKAASALRGLRWPSVGLTGLWESWKRPGIGDVIETFTIITTVANAFMTPIHNRMPVLLSDHDSNIWIDPQENIPRLLSTMLQLPDDDALVLIAPGVPE